MRVICSSISQFIDVLSDEVEKHPNGSMCVYRKVVHVNRMERPMGGGAAREDIVKWEIILQASTVIRLRSDEEFLLEAGELCGIDYRDKTSDDAGTKNADLIMAALRGRCKVWGLQIQPGVIGY